MIWKMRRRRRPGEGPTANKLESRLEEIGLTDVRLLASNFPYYCQPGRDAVTWTGYATLNGMEYQLFSYFPMGLIAKVGARRYDPLDYQLEIVPDQEGMGGIGRMKVRPITH
jgi:hypothetical protein